MIPRFGDYGGDVLFYGGLAVLGYALGARLGWSPLRRALEFVPL